MNSSFIYGFLLGCAVSGVVQYWRQKRYNSCQHVAWAETKKLDLQQLFNDYPGFMLAIKEDLGVAPYSDIREFFVVDQQAILNSAVPRLRYELSTEILPALNKLEALGYIEKLKNNCLHYKITEDFVLQLKMNVVSHEKGGEDGGDQIRPYYH